VVGERKEQQGLCNGRNDNSKGVHEEVMVTRVMLFCLWPTPRAYRPGPPGSARHALGECLCGLGPRVARWLAALTTDLLVARGTLLSMDAVLVS